MKIYTEIEKTRCCILCKHLETCPIIKRWVQATDSPIEVCSLYCSEFVAEKEEAMADEIGKTKAKAVLDKAEDEANRAFLKVINQALTNRDWAVAHARQVYIETLTGLTGDILEDEQ